MANTSTTHDQREAASRTLEKITRVRLPSKPSSTLWDVAIKDGKISAVLPHNASSNVHDPDVLDGGKRLIGPSLCHAHIHLDKCFLLQDPDFSDLQIESGDFQEALKLTNEAKSRFEEDNLLRRGRQLIEESIRFGVTVMRAFVEVDGLVQLKCLHAGLRLKDEFKERCEVQICAFAQLPLFSGDDEGAAVRRLMTNAAAHDSVGVLGSTPYVEEDEAKSAENVRWTAQLALEQGKHLDLHMDYFLEENRRPLIWTTLSILKELDWTKATGNKRVAFGHCTRLTKFKKQEWFELKQEIGEFPVSFVGLPTSDLYMMRTKENLRGTLHVVELIRDHGLDAAISVNNVGNAFTPQGNCDPLSIASLGVGLYQAGTKGDAELLYETVSSRAKVAIGYEATPWNMTPGHSADFVLFDCIDSGWRCRKSIAEVVCDPGHDRQTIFQGRVIVSSP